jgi:sugar (pentulose or hexulose) kinase
MSTIDPTARLLGSLRRQAEELRKKNPGLARNTTETAGHPPNVSRDPLSLATPQLLLIDRHDPQACRKAFKVYLTCVLAQEFGTDIINDPGFAVLVDQVQLTMENDPQLLKAMSEAGDHLMRAVHESQAS